MIKQSEGEKMKSKHGVIMLVVAALIAIGTGFAHFSCIFFGLEWYAAQMAPSILIE